MECRLDKCAETIFKKAKLVNKEIYEHEQGKTYQYHKHLGIEENEGIKCTKRGYYFRISKHKMYRRQVRKYR
jgi:hypothetical protein